ncbi:MAG: ABC transporter permease [Planctomycetes bacterium]|nr:ABC transporter permease [Planctomycetota bacterium]
MDSPTKQISDLGSRFLRYISGCGMFVVLLCQTVRAVFRKWPKKSILLRQFYVIGNQSFLIVFMTGAFTGMVLALQSYYMLRKVEFTNMIGAIVGVSIVRELGPVLVALMLSGRVGAAIAAELGTMKVTEQIDALRVLSANPVKYLVLPRFLACVLLLPILTLMADCMGIISGYIVSVNFMNISDFYYIQNTHRYLGLWDLMSGLIKSVFFGGIIAITASYKGLNAEAGAEGVGKATTSAVVTSCVLVLAANFLLTLIM